MMREKRHLIWRNIWILSTFLVVLTAQARSSEAQQYYPDEYYANAQRGWPGYQDAQPPPLPARRHRGQTNNYRRQQAQPNLQYDQRDAERIMREQMAAANPYAQQYDPGPLSQMYDPYNGNPPPDEGQIRRVMAEARQLGAFLQNRNAKPYIVIDKRNFQFYLYNRDGGLLRIGPVAIGKGKTEVGAFETPVGIFPIRSKVPVDDWIRPDWYFKEEGEPIPTRWEDRRVPGFFRYKLVFNEQRYIHYAEATGGRLTHGCLGLDWQDAEAVFHTLEVGSYCIVVDQGLLARLAKGEFPVSKPAPVKPSQPDEMVVTVAPKPDNTRSAAAPQPNRTEARAAFQNLW